MAGSTIGTLFAVTTYGESHGQAIGAVIDGCPAGLSLAEKDIQADLDRRKPGQSLYASKRKENDRCRIVSGVFDGKTTGAPISILIENENANAKDYADIASFYRPGHADYTYDAKYGFRDYRGGGRSSGRETAGRVAAGAVARKVLGELGIEVLACTKSIGPISIADEAIDMGQRFDNPLVMPDKEAYEKAAAYLDKLMEEKDSAGGVCRCMVKGLSPGIGQPVFSKLDAEISKAVMSIGAVKGIEFGMGFRAASATAGKSNDLFTSSGGIIYKQTNHSGGVLGGISDGGHICFNAYIKPTPSIGQEQESVDKSGKVASKAITGRHDPVIVPRAVVVVEAMTCITLCDLLLQNMSSRMDNIRKIYL